ncbi:MAG: hypothetical protein E7363_06200 [Clostridiales bacterium]|nr:hypothetical protein [Clostridiales bacterium]
MKNLWILFIIYSATLIGCIIGGVYMVVKKERFYQIVAPLLASVVVVLFLFNYIPYTKDIVKQETTQIIVVYTKWGSGDGVVINLFFEIGKETITLKSPRVAKTHVKMKTGSKYKIDYFNNSKLIKSYVLVE